MKGILFRLTFTTALLMTMYVFATAQRASPAQTAEGQIGEATITINYSAPSVKGRSIWGGLVPYGAVWRTGANEATSFETTADLKIGKQNLPAGKYGVFTIPDESEWTVIFSSVWDTWGTNYSEKNDVVRVKAPFKMVSDKQEQMKFAVGEDNVQLMWDNGVLTIPVKAK